MPSIAGVTSMPGIHMHVWFEQLASPKNVNCAASPPEIIAPASVTCGPVAVTGAVPCSVVLTVPDSVTSPTVIPEVGTASQLSGIDCPPNGSFEPIVSVPLMCPVVPGVGLHVTDTRPLPCAPTSPRPHLLITPTGFPATVSIGIVVVVQPPLTVRLPVESLVITAVGADSVLPV